MTVQVACPAHCNHGPQSSSSSPATDACVKFEHKSILNALQEEEHQEHSYE